MTETDRYARHRLIGWWDQERLSNAHVIVVGAGAIGNEVIKNLALLGIGGLVIIDSDTIEVSNLTRCVLFRLEDVGRSKAIVAAEAARALNPDIRAEAIEGDLEFDIGLGTYRDAGMVIGCLDSIGARLALNRMCRRAGVPWLNGGIESTVAEVSLFDGRSGACYECSMSAEMWEARNRRFSCGGLRSDEAEAAAPTTVIAASAVASILANELVLHLHRTKSEPGEGLQFGQRLFLSMKPYFMGVYDLPQSAECLAHDTWEPVERIGQTVVEGTARTLLELTGERDAVIELGFDLLTKMVCTSCGAVETILAPLERCGVQYTHCPTCGAATRRPEVVTWLDAESPWADVSFHRLGLPDSALVGIQSRTGRRYARFRRQGAATDYEKGG